jgi:CBS domain containing-hemolysin-like protein
MSDPARTSRFGRVLAFWNRRRPSSEVRPLDVPEGQSQGLDLISQAEVFQSLKVADVMTPRADIVAIEVDSVLADVVAMFLEAEHSRMPIYRETLDDPLGVVHIKDVFRLLAEAPEAQASDTRILRKIRRKVHYVPASMRAANLLLKMQASRIHMALVIDEFGGCDGLVTLEDLVEAVFGDIDDEHDDEHVPGLVRRAGGVVEADARTPLEELETELGCSLAPEDLEEEIETVAGLVTAIAGRVPQRGEVISHNGGFDLEVMDADPRRVKRVRIRTRLPPEIPT